MMATYNLYTPICHLFLPVPQLPILGVTVRAISDFQVDSHRNPMRASLSYQLPCTRSDRDPWNLWSTVPACSVPQAFRHSLLCGTRCYCAAVFPSLGSCSPMVLCLATPSSLTVGSQLEVVNHCHQTVGRAVAREPRAMHPTGQ